MKKFVTALIFVAGCAAAPSMEATHTEQVAIGGLQNQLRQVEQAIAAVSTDRATQNKILGIAFGLVEVERAERQIAEDAAKSRGLDGVALVLSGTTWSKR